MTKKDIAMQVALRLRGEIRVLEDNYNKQRLYIHLPSEDAIMDNPSRYTRAMQRTRDELRARLEEFPRKASELDV